jgi:hypothetical protein
MGTLAAFRAALGEVLECPQQQLPAEVAALLRHWQVHDVSLAASRRQWLDSTTDTQSTEIANFKQQQDRMAMCAYIITGQLLDADVGSVVMFAVPEGVGEKAFNELFLQVSVFEVCRESECATRP